MGASHGDFVKYPRTPHLFGAKGTEDDKRLSVAASEELIADDSLIVEEKIDGTNVGIHFSQSGELVLQCRGHLITAGMHPQYDLFKQWASAKRQQLEEVLACRYILFGEWVYARHTIHYKHLPHYLFEFDIYDKQAEAFIDLDRRLKLLENSGIPTVPILHRGPITRKELRRLVGPSKFDSTFSPTNHQQSDNLVEGLYLRTEAAGVVTRRAKFVRPEFVESLKHSNHWQQERLVPNVLSEDADIWS